MGEMVYGVIYPVPERYMRRFFEGKTIFVKYLPRKAKGLESGTKLLLYASGISKTIMGEATIRKVEYMPLDLALQKYEDNIFLTKDELLEYSHKFGNREKKDLLLLHLKNIKKYTKPVTYPKPITMAGLYIDRDAYLSSSKK